MIYVFTIGYIQLYGQCTIVVGKEQDSDDEQIDKKSIMQKTLYFLKKYEMNNDK